jgi:hypothetical protein
MLGTVAGALDLKQEALMLAVGECCVHITPLDDNVDDLQMTLGNSWRVKERILARPSPPIQCVGDLPKHGERVVSGCPECPNKNSSISLAQHQHLLVALRLLQLHANIRVVNMLDP